MEEIKTQRKSWVDILRALAMVFVLYGHLVQENTTFFVFTSPIKIPLFFALSGYLFKDRGGDVKLFLKKLLLTLVVPWLALSFIPIIALSFLYGVTYFREEAISILIGESVWYMPCCIIAEIIYFLMRKFLKSTYKLATAVCVCFIAGILLDRFNLLNVFMINTSLIVQLFIFIGHIFKIVEERITKLHFAYTVSAMIVYIALCTLSIFAFPGECLDVHHNYYYNIPFCLLLIFIGLFSLMSLAKRIEKNKKLFKPLIFIGRNTLVYYIWGGYAVLFINIALKIFKIGLPSNLFTAFLIMLIQCVVLAIASLFLNRFLPVFVGKKRRVKKQH